MYSRALEGREPMVPSRALPKAKSANNQKNKKPKNKKSSRSSEISLAPVAMASKQGFPSRRASMKSHRFANSELIGSVNGSVSFTATRYDVNPGIATTFPWLSVEAAQWEQYRFHRLSFRYVTRTSTSTVGSVILSPDYAIRDLAPTTEKQATNTQDAVENSVWKDLVCDLDPNAMFPLGPRKLIRSAMIGSDQNLYDAAAFYLCTVEEADASAIGKLWVDYEVEFFVPQNSPADTSGPTKMSWYALSGDQTLSTGVTTAVLFDTIINDPLKIGTPAAGVWTPPAGVYQIRLELAASDTSAESFTVSMNLYKNGALASAYVSGRDVRTAVASGTSSVVISGIIAFNGSDTCQVSGALTGAAGTLKVLSGYTRILFAPV